MADRTSAAQDFRADVSTRLMKPACRIATTGALAAYTRAGNTITADANGLIGTAGAIDGVTVAVGDRLLLKNGADAEDEGIWTVRSIGGASALFILDRAWDFRESSQVRTGCFTYVSEGSTNGGTYWFVAAEAPFVLNTDDPTWTPFPNDDAVTALLASTSNGDGAALVAIEDADSLLTATDVEAALAEIRTPVVRAVAAGENVTLTPADHGRTVTFSSDAGGAATIAVGTLPAGGRVILQMSTFNTDAYTATVSGGTLTFNATGELAEVYYDGTDLIVLSLAGATVV